MPTVPGKQNYTLSPLESLSEYDTVFKKNVSVTHSDMEKQAWYMVKAGKWLWN